MRRDNAPMRRKDSARAPRKMDITFDVKQVGDDGTFSGYGSVFEVLDSYREVVKPGAFQKSLADWNAKGKLPPILWNHNSDKPIGIYTLMREDERGLYVEGKLLVDDVQQARETHALLKAGAISGMSIGYRVVKDETDGKSGVRRLLELKLYEVSVVTFPANEAATVTTVKSILEDGQLPSLPEFEKFLREAGFTKSQATAIAGGGLAKLLRSESGNTEANTLGERLLATINGN